MAKEGTGLMPDYDFSQLSPHDFENLTRDLLQAEWGVLLESFTEGQDGGVDLRYLHDGARLVVQCKRYVATPMPTILATLKKEADKGLKAHPCKNAR